MKGILKTKIKAGRQVHKFTHTRKVYEYLPSIYIPSVLLLFAQPYILTPLERQNLYCSTWSF
jgi:hypothetical protein